MKVGHCQAPLSRPSKVFLSRVLFYARLENQGKKEKEELALLLSLSPDFNGDERREPDSKS